MVCIRMCKELRHYDTEIPKKTHHGNGLKVEHSDQRRAYLVQTAVYVSMRVACSHQGVSIHLKFLLPNPCEINIIQETRRFTNLFLIF